MSGAVAVWLQYLALRPPSFLFCCLHLLSELRDQAAPWHKNHASCSLCLRFLSEGDMIEQPSPCIGGRFLFHVGE